MESLQKNQTWDFVELPEGKQEVGCKWIFKKKSWLSTKEVIFYKARLIAKCYNQKEGMNYNKIFSPVVRQTSIHVLLALVATLEMKLEQLNVKTVFLHGRLEKDILMQQHEDFEVEEKENFVCRLKMSLYGPTQWPK